MASILARRARISRLQQCRIASRSFTQSAPALKKRGSTSALDADDLFGSASTEEALFPSSLGGQNTSSSRHSSAFQKPRARKGGKKQTTVAPVETKSDSELFEENLKYITERIGPQPVTRHPQIGRRALRKMLYYVRSAEQFEHVAQVLAMLRKEKKRVDIKIAEDIFNRYLAWSPTTLLPILSNRAKYALIIPNITIARQILHRLVLYRPHEILMSTSAEEKMKSNAEALKDAASFAALMPSHSLGNATDDVVCAALLAQACARNLVFAEQLAEKQRERDQASSATDATTAESTEKDAKDSALRTKSTRGLVEISSMLAELLAKNREEGGKREELAPASESTPTARSGLFSYFSRSETKAPTSSESNTSATALQDFSSTASSIPTTDLEYVRDALQDVLKAFALPFVRKVVLQKEKTWVVETIELALKAGDAPAVDPDHKK